MGGPAFCCETTNPHAEIWNDLQIQAELAIMSRIIVKAGVFFVTYYFDEKIDRSGTDSVNVQDYQSALFGAGADISFPCAPEQLIRMWVADMEFATPDVIIKAMERRLQRRIFGYSKPMDLGYYEAFSAWTQRRYGWKCSAQELLISHGIVPALNDLVRYLCKPGDKVLILTPSYGPFRGAAAHNGITCVYSPLKKSGAHYEMDFADLEEKLRDPDVKVCIFCNPHNPTGRLWTKEELERFGALCVQQNVWLISDEIHCDLLRSGREHLPLAKLLPDYQKLVTCMAPSKTFNIAGLLFSNVIIRDEQLRKTWLEQHDDSENPLSLVAARAAYEEGEPWLIQLLSYLDGNFALVKEQLETRLPQAVFAIPEATYLAWVDLSAYFKPEERLTRYFAEQAGILLEDGSMFVGNGAGCIRLNLACPRAMVAEAIDRLCRVVQGEAIEQWGSCQ